VDHRQKRARRQRRLQHQKATAMGKRRIYFSHDGKEIPQHIARELPNDTLSELTYVDVDRGAPPSDSRHKNDPPKHGERLDARGLNVKALREIGLENPSEEVLRDFARLTKTLGSRAAAKHELSKHLNEIVEYQRRRGPARRRSLDNELAKVVTGSEVVEVHTQAEAQAVFDHVLNDPEVKEGVAVARTPFEDEIGHDESSPADHGDEAYANRVPKDEWEKLAATAKCRKRGTKGYIKVLTDAGYELLSDDHDPRERESWVRAS
jgi:hypothetical protein